jgi:hypothetical protein
MSLNRKPSPRSRRLIVIFSLFRRVLSPERTIDSVSRLKDEVPDFSRIRCPLCRWRPNASSIWCCADNDDPEHFYGGCGARWNTFITRGLCPGCAHLWHWTACLSCEGWSPHDDWYAVDGE